MKPRAEELTGVQRTKKVVGSRPSTYRNPPEGAPNVHRRTDDRTNVRFILRRRPPWLNLRGEGYWLRWPGLPLNQGYGRKEPAGGCAPKRRVASPVAREISGRAACHLARAARREAATAKIGEQIAGRTGAYRRAIVGLATVGSRAAWDGSPPGRPRPSDCCAPNRRR